MKTQYNTKITETEGKISSITALTTSTALNAVDNKMPNVNNLVKKAEKILGIESKYFTTSNYNKFTSEILMQR